jgi:hypothetical protein
MTPPDWRIHVKAWNAANDDGTPKPPTEDEFEELKRKYG